jgi:hypothetical protein
MMVGYVDQGWYSLEQDTALTAGQFAHERALSSYQRPPEHQREED